MNPAATSKFTVSLVSPQTPNTDPESFDFTSELLQRKEILNVSTLNSLMTESGSPQLITSTPKSGQFYVSNGSTVAESDGVIQLIPSPWFANRAVLIVTGSTNEGVYKAGRALGTKSNFPNFSGQLVLVRDVHPTESKSIEFLPEISLKQLGYSDQVITGLGVTNISYRFYLPSKYYLSQDAKFQFFFSHSALLDPTASSLTLTMNNTPFASVLLDESNAERGVIEAFLPVSASHPGELNSLGVTVNTQVPDLCSMSASGTNQLWVNLQSDSILSLPVVDNPLTNNYNLDRLPMPFVINPNLEQTKFALPLDPSDIEYAAAFRVAAWLASKSVGNNFNPKVILGTPGLEKELSDFNLIVIGRPSRNTMLQVLNDDLPQPFILGKDIIRQQVDNVIFRIPEEMDLGYMQLLQSKWNQENLILAITGTTDLSLHRVIDSLIDDIKNNSVKGNLVLIPNDVDVFATDTRSMLLSGKLNVLGTAIPAIGIIGTATPNLPTLETAPTEPPVQGIIRNRPSWLPFVSAILGAVLSVVVLRILYIRARSRQS